MEFSVISVSFNLEQVNSIHPECRFHLEIQEEETRCAEILRAQTETFKGKAGPWRVSLCPDGVHEPTCKSLAPHSENWRLRSPVCFKKSLLPLSFNELLAKLIAL